MLAGTKNKKWICLGAFLMAAALFAFFPVATDAEKHCTEAEGKEKVLCLENDYPKIPLPKISGTGVAFEKGAYSLNDIAAKVAPFHTIDPLGGLIYYLFVFSVSVVGIVAFGVLIYTGVMFMMSGARPQLRMEAKTRLRNVVLGIALLLGSVLLLNTINPELSIIKVPDKQKEGAFTFDSPEVSGITSLAPEVFAPTVVNIDSLRYGGVVVFEDAGDRSTGKSETIFHDVENFSTASYMGANDKISALKVLGKCSLTLDGPEGSNLTGSLVGPTDIVPLGDLTGKVRQLLFGAHTCLGHSLKVYDSPNQNRDALKTSGGGSGAKDSRGTTIFLDDHSDLGKISFSNPLLLAENRIESVRFAINVAGATATLFNGKYFQGDTKGGQVVLSPASTAIPPDYANKASSIRMSVRSTTEVARQAGVILYSGDDFSGRSEVLISGDPNFGGNLMGHAAVSSLKIIGKYKVTFYEKNLNDAGGGETLFFDNTKDRLEFTLGSFFGGGPDQAPKRNSLGVVEIPKLSGYVPVSGNNWDNKISAIKIEVPLEIHEAQKLTPSCKEETTGLCTL